MMGPLGSMIPGAFAGVFAHRAASLFIVRPGEARLSRVVPESRPGGAAAAGALICLLLAHGAGLPPVIAVALTVSLMSAALVDLRLHLAPDMASLAVAILAVISGQIQSGLMVERLAVAGGLALGLYLLQQAHRLMRTADGVGLGDIKLLAVMALWLPPIGCGLLLGAAVAGGGLQALTSRTGAAPLAAFAVPAFVILLAASGWGLA